MIRVDSGQITNHITTKYYSHKLYQVAQEYEHYLMIIR